MENAIAWIFIFPLFGAVACALLGMVNRKFCNPVAVLSMAGATWAGVETLLQAVASPQAEVSYILGGWTLDLFPRGVGIEFRADLLGGLIALVVLGVGFIVSIYAKLPVERETPNKESFYPLLGFFVPYKLRDVFRSPKPTRSNFPRTNLYLQPGTSLAPPPRAKTTECFCNR